MVVCGGKVSSPVAEDKGHQALASILALLAEVREGGYNGRLEALPADDSLAPVHEGINAILEVLVRERRRNAVYRDELEEARTTIELQRAAIREISSPIIEVGRGVLCLPLVGIMSAERSEGVLDALLAAVSERGARCVVVDVTGLSGMDIDTVRWLLRLAGAVQLLGARCALTGIGSELARTIVHADFEVTGLTTLSSVREALERFARASG